MDLVPVVLKNWVRARPRLAIRYRSLRRRWLKMMRSSARRAILRRLPRGAVCVEVGVWAGDFSERILRVSRPAKLYLVDAWQFMPEFPKAWYGGGIAEGQAFMDELYESVVDKFAGAGQTEIVRATSLGAAQVFEDRSIDWIYLDSNHSYDAVSADLKAWLPKIRPGGLLGGDDYHERGAWFQDGVKRAVDEAVAEGLAQLEWLRGEQFLLRLP